MTNAYYSIPNANTYYSIPITSTSTTDTIGSWLVTGGGTWAVRHYPVVSNLTASLMNDTISIPDRLPPRAFNKYINASDLLEEFIAFAGLEGVRQSEVLNLPLDLFIKWLVIRACEQDNEEPDVVLELPAPKKQPHCLGCGQFMSSTSSPFLHSEKCAHYYFGRQELVRRL